jgi:death on curing protein
VVVVCITAEHVIEAHQKAMERSDSPIIGVANVGAIESIVHHMANDDYYPSFADKLTHLLFGLTKGHCFTEGNKRAAAASAEYMLTLNDHPLALSFMEDIENIVVDVADNKIDRPLLRDIIGAMLEFNYDENEELKLRVYEAISRT